MAWLFTESKVDFDIILTLNVQQKINLLVHKVDFLNLQTNFVFV